MSSSMNAELPPHLQIPMSPPRFPNGKRVAKKRAPPTPTPLAKSDKESIPTNRALASGNSNNSLQFSTSFRLSLEDSEDTTIDSSDNTMNMALKEMSMLPRDIAASIKQQLASFKLEGIQLHDRFDTSHRTLFIQYWLGGCAVTSLLDTSLKEYRSGIYLVENLQYTKPPVHAVTIPNLEDCEDEERRGSLTSAELSTRMQMARGLDRANAINSYSPLDSILALPTVEKEALKDDAIKAASINHNQEESPIGLGNFDNSPKDPSLCIKVNLNNEKTAVVTLEIPEKELTKGLVTENDQVSSPVIVLEQVKAVQDKEHKATGEERGSITIASAKDVVLNTRFIRPATLTDSTQILDLYNYYVQHSILTGDDLPVEESDILRLMSRCKHENLPMIVAVESRTPLAAHNSSAADKIIGVAFAEVHQVDRSTIRIDNLRQTIRLSLYTDHRYTRDEVGTNLLDRLLYILTSQEQNVTLKKSLRFNNPEYDPIYYPQGRNRQPQIIFGVNLQCNTNSVDAWLERFMFKFNFSGVGRLISTYTSLSSDAECQETRTIYFKAF